MNAPLFTGDFIADSCNGSEGCTGLERAKYIQVGPRSIAAVQFIPSSKSGTRDVRGMLGSRLLRIKRDPVVVNASAVVVCGVHHRWKLDSRTKSYYGCTVFFIHQTLPSPNRLENTVVRRSRLRGCSTRKEGKLWRSHPSHSAQSTQVLPCKDSILIGLSLRPLPDGPAGIDTSSPKLSRYALLHVSISSHEFLLKQIEQNR